MLSDTVAITRLAFLDAAQWCERRLGRENPRWASPSGARQISCIVRVKATMQSGMPDIKLARAFLKKHAEDITGKRDALLRLISEIDRDLGSYERSTASATKVVNEIAGFGNDSRTFMLRGAPGIRSVLSHRLRLASASVIARGQAVVATSVQAIDKEVNLIGTNDDYDLECLGYYKDRLRILQERMARFSPESVTGFSPRVPKNRVVVRLTPANPVA